MEQRTERQRVLLTGDQIEKLEKFLKQGGSSEQAISIIEHEDGSITFRSDHMHWQVGSDGKYLNGV